MAQANATQGKIVQCIGAVVDVEFPRDKMPGVYDALKEEVQPGFLSILDPTDAKIAPPEGANSSGRRSVLAGTSDGPTASGGH